ncbi:MAG: hypothetical protein ABI382_02450 [Nakamurella sp.]
MSLFITSFPLGSELNAYGQNAPETSSTEYVEPPELSTFQFEIGTVFTYVTVPPGIAVPVFTVSGSPPTSP